MCQLNHHSGAKEQTESKTKPYTSHSKWNLLFSRSVVYDSVRPYGLQHQAPLSFTILEFAQTHVHGVSDAIQIAHPLVPPFPPDLNGLMVKKSREERHEQMGHKLNAAIATATD